MFFSLCGLVWAGPELVAGGMIADALVHVRERLAKEKVDDSKTEVTSDASYDQSRHFRERLQQHSSTRFGIKSNNKNKEEEVASIRASLARPVSSK